MGTYGNFLNQASSTLKDLNGLSNGVSGIFGALGIGENRRIKKQLEAQKQLNEQAASLNYMYGEKAAQNAYKRQMEMYERSYQDQSYEAMRKQMEDAGLSVGLMYGGAGAGGQGGATSGAPQGETGGAVAGDAGSLIAAQMQQELGLRQLAMQTEVMKADIKLKEKQGDDYEAAAEEKRARTKTENESRNVKIEQIRQEARKTWMANNNMEYEDLGMDLKGDEWGGVTLFKNDILGKHSIVAGRLKNTKNQNEILQSTLELARTESDTELKGSAKEANEAYVNLLAIQEKLTEANIEKIFFDMVIDAFNAETGRLEANAKKLATEHSIGEYVNWRTYYEAAIEGAQAIGTIIGGIGVGRAVGATLTRVMNPEEKRPQVKGFAGRR